MSTYSVICLVNNKITCSKSDLAAAIAIKLLCKATFLERWTRSINQPIQALTALTTHVILSSL